MLRWGLIFFLAMQSLPASAGPWGRAEDQFYIRIAVSRLNVEGLNGYRSDAYSEYGLNGDWTLTLKYERLDFNRFNEFSSDGVRTTLRRSFSVMPGLVASLEGGVLQGAAIGGAAGCETLGAEVRAGLGQSLQLGKKTKRDIFWFAEGALRAHDDGCLRRRLELGYGQKLTRDIWIISQLWFDTGTVNATSSKYQLEYLWRAGRLDISAGTQLEFGGAFEENAYFIALARRF